jgi:8-oxo-dGTP pyrophosphatase MutT (NUDIX family)
LRLESREHRVLVGRRPPEARFLPGRYVFPGGAVEPDDSRARPASALNAGMIDSMAVGGNGIRALGHGVAPALHRLAYVGRAITPVPSPIRFHARFFVADAQYTTGALGGDSELEDLHWCSVNELARLPTIEVQSFMLAHAITTLTGNDSNTTGTPLFTQRAGQRYIRYFKPRL